MFFSKKCKTPGRLYINKYAFPLLLRLGNNQNNCTMLTGTVIDVKHYPSFSVTFSFMAFNTKVKTMRTNELSHLVGFERTRDERVSALTRTLDKVAKLIKINVKIMEELTDSLEKEVKNTQQ